MRIFLFFWFNLVVVAANYFWNINNTLIMTIDGRVHGGMTASKNQFPYFVTVRKQIGKCGAYRYYTCGGSLISNTFVLSAAHCTTHYNVEKMVSNILKKVIIYLGNTYYLQGKKFHVKPSNIINHPNYDPENLLNDISLIRIPFISYSGMHNSLLKLKYTFIYFCYI